MRHWSFILVVALLVVLVAGAGGLYFYDRSNEDMIAEGVTVAGVVVGGLSSDQARAKVRRQVARETCSRAPTGTSLAAPRMPGSRLGSATPSAPSKGS